MWSINPSAASDSRDGSAERHRRVRADLAVGNRFEVVGAGQKTRQFAAEALILARQTRELGMNPAMGPRHLAAVLVRSEPARREIGKISGAPGGFGKANAGNRARFAKRLPDLVEVARRLRLHRSMPSRRISCISGVCSR